jgi:hypothetical protein
MHISNFKPKLWVFFFCFFVEVRLHFKRNDFFFFNLNNIPINLHKDGKSINKIMKILFSPWPRWLNELGRWI